jgi:pimeloyl-ACP methyl ester carboxylesterase
MPEARVDGVRLDWALHGRGEPLVCLHGLQGDSSHFHGLLPALSAAHRTLLFDQRGSGRSDKPAGDYTTALLADDTAALMDHVGFDAAHVFGVSMGGMIAQELALRHPRRVRSLILGCTRAGGPTAVPVAEHPAFAIAYASGEIPAEERARAFARVTFTDGYLDAHPEVVERLAAARRERPLDPEAFARRRRAIDRHDTFDRLPALRCPTLVLTGRQDRIVAWENSRILAERIPGARLEVLDPAGHLFWIEQAAATEKAVLAFLAGPRAATRGP